MDEKRAFPRVRISFPVRCEDLASHKPFYTVFKDISEGGIKLISEDFMPINKSFKFEINLINNLVKGRGRIVWCNSQPFSERYLAGIQFIDIEPNAKDRLSKFLSNINLS